MGFIIGIVSYAVIAALFIVISIILLLDLRRNYLRIKSHIKKPGKKIKNQDKKSNIKHL